MGASEVGSVRAVLQVAGDMHLLDVEVAPRIHQASGPGRYVMVTAGEGRDPYLPRPFWVRRLADGRLRLLVREAGRGSRWLVSRRPGDEISFYGPLGKELHPPPRTRRLLLHGGPEALNCLLALADAAQQRGIEAALALEREETALASGLLPPDLELLPGLGEESLRWADALYCAGEPGVLQRAQALLRSAGVRLPAYGLPHAPLACGVGACYGCVVLTRAGQRLSCVDGPAFELRELVWT